MRFQSGLLRASLSTLMICLLGASSQAQLTEEFATKMELPSAASKRKTETDGLVKMEASDYPSPIPGKPHLDQSLLASTRLKANTETESSNAKIDFIAESYLDWGVSQYSVQELYWGYNHDSSVNQTTVGRKLEYWSQTDQDWQLGIWQPESLFDSLRPVDQGLTGVFSKLKYGKFESLAFISPIFIPTMGPEVKEEDGSLVSDSRWHQSPSSHFILFGKQRKIVYSLNVPDVWDLVQKPGIGYRARWGGDEPGFWVSGNLGYKPMNSLLLKYDQKLGSSEEGEDTGSAPLYPIVGYHFVGGADVGYKLEKSNFALSYLEDAPQPIDQNEDDPFIVQRPTGMKAYSAHADTEVNLAGFAEPVVLAVGYLLINGGTYEDFDAKGKSYGAVFSQRFHFNHAASLQAQFSTVLFRKKLISKFKYLREFDQRGMVGTGEFHFFPITDLALTVGADVLGVDNPSVEGSDDRFLNQFRANDRVYGGVSYVF